MARTSAALKRRNAVARSSAAMRVSSPGGFEVDDGAEFGAELGCPRCGSGPSGTSRRHRRGTRRPARCRSAAGSPVSAGVSGRRSGHRRPTPRPVPPVGAPRHETVTVEDLDTAVTGCHLDAVTDQFPRHRVARRAEPHRRQLVHLAPLAASQRWPQTGQRTKRLTLIDETLGGNGGDLSMRPPVHFDAPATRRRVGSTDVVAPVLGGHDQIALRVAGQGLDHSLDSGSAASQKSGRKPKWMAKRT